MRIIPAIDIIDGKCVRLTQGAYNSKIVYNENPVEVAKKFEDYGIQYLHLVDLDGAKAQNIINHKIISDIATQTHLKIDFGGGIKSDEALKIAFDNGAHQITCGSIAVKNPELVASWISVYGPQKIILGADAKDRKIMTQGWTNPSDLDVVDFILSFQSKGIDYVICTDISKDGMMEGCAFDLYQEILDKTSVKLIASGGVSTLEDLYRLKELSCEGAIIGKALYEGKISLASLRHFIHS